ncbi:lytic transglycosylase domain-containing protein [Nocardioides marmorisolisilvae]|uniref:aggregation-promoting factor C-terminal-like domain-containing protein n=1 Tax=Nocardioides marmorisolisilvae TaxID=1542737 RepID=UPI001FE83833|nr:lytic transglycosylase domain-containing protein [Nocardioides marmorisolisilvae]
MTESYAPKHRSAPPKRVRKGAKKGAKNAVLFSGAAMFATALSISAGVAAEGKSPEDTLVNLTAGKSQLTEADLAAREQSASRSSDRTAARTSVLKSAELGSAKGVAVTRTANVVTLTAGVTSSGARAIAQRLLAEMGMSASEFNCLDSLWTGESGWRVHASNPSGAYGIPQALPGSKMASAGADWQNSAETQIKWGLGYIKNRYGTPCGAWSFKQGHGWY